MNKGSRLIHVFSLLGVVASLAMPIQVFAQDSTPTDPAQTPEVTLADIAPVEISSETAPIDTTNPELGLMDVTQAIVDTAAAVSAGDPSGVLGAAVYGAPAGSPFNYLPEDGSHPDGTCDFAVTTPGTLTCYWASPIQNAVTDAAVGSTVSVGAGDYTEQLDINKNLTLRAVGIVTLHSPDVLATKFTTTGDDKPIIFISGADNVTLDGFVINGDGKGNTNSRFIGIAYYNAGGVVSNNTILGITDTPLSSDQQGVGILVLNADAVARSITITGNDVSEYQKTGIEVLGSGLTATISDNTVAGSGTTSLTAQNGIEVGNGATGIVTGNEVSGNDFSGSGYTATGILEIGPTTGLTISNNYLHENQANLYLYEGNNITVTGNILAGGTWGVVASSGITGNLTATLVHNTITANTLGVYVDNPNVVFHQNNILGNTTGLWFNDTKSTGGTVDASQNYWGCATGANTPGCDTTVGSVNISLPLAYEVIHPPMDRTFSIPLAGPNQAISTPRYISGFGSDNSYTIFYEDRKLACSGAYRIVFNQTTQGAEGFSNTSTATNICDSHFTVKDWPFTFGGNSYAYRAWGAGTYSGSHRLYGSNDLINWTLLTTFTFPIDKTIVDSQVLYGFHDVVQINGKYLGFAETAGGFTVIVESPDGLNNWTEAALVGGSNSGNNPLNLLYSQGPTPTGNFVLMEVNGHMVYAKLMVPGDRSGAYLAINAAAANAATPALAEAAFKDPANWTWMDGTTGVPGAGSAFLLNSTGSGGHDVKEVWMVPSIDPLTRNVILYDATYASNAKGLGCASDTPECVASSGSISPDRDASSAPGSFTSLELNPQIIPTQPVPSQDIVPGPFIPPAPFIVPVTGGQFVGLSCVAPTTLFLVNGTRVTFNSPLCNYAASLTGETETTIPLAIPQGNIFGIGATIEVRNGSVLVDVLPDGVSTTFSFPKQSGAIDNAAVLFWDVQANQGIGGWVELPVLGAIKQGDPRRVVIGLAEVNDTLQFTANFTGTFILVSK